jgi:hypothetical protein
MDQPRDEASLNRQGCRLAAMLVIAAASRDFRIGRLECLHIDQAAARETVPRRHTGIKPTSISRRLYWIAGIARLLRSFLPALTG